MVPFGEKDKNMNDFDLHFLLDYLLLCSGAFQVVGLVCFHWLVFSQDRFARYERSGGIHSVPFRTDCDAG